MASSGMLRRVALIRANVSEELSASIIRVTRISELGTLLVTSNYAITTQIHKTFSIIFCVLQICRRWGKRESKNETKGEDK
jgi:hypothetical protein